jgi:hypothetical protein
MPFFTSWPAVISFPHFAQLTVNSRLPGDLSDRNVLSGRLFRGLSGCGGGGSWFRRGRWSWRGLWFGFGWWCRCRSCRWGSLLFLHLLLSSLGPFLPLLGLGQNFTSPRGYCGLKIMFWWILARGELVALCSKKLPAPQRCLSRRCLAVGERHVTISAKSITAVKRCATACLSSWSRRASASLLHFRVVKI